MYAVEKKARDVSRLIMKRHTEEKLAKFIKIEREQGEGAHACTVTMSQSHDEKETDCVLSAAKRRPDVKAWASCPALRQRKTATWPAVGFLPITAVHSAWAAIFCRQCHINKRAMQGYTSGCHDFRISSPVDRVIRSLGSSD